MARILTPERQKLKDKALALRYDYGWTERRIANSLNVSRGTLHHWLVHNSHKGMVHNNGTIRHFEGDCFEYSSLYSSINQ